MRDRREADRRRVRLRPGKILDASGRFIADCAILDHSAGGIRIRSFSDEPVPETCRLLDESDGVARAVTLVWQRDGRAGLRAAGAAEVVDGAAYREVAGPYYAVR